MGDEAMHYVRQLDEPEVIVPPNDPVVLRHLQGLFFDGGRILVIGGWLVVIHSFGNPTASPAHVSIGFLLLLLGVLLIVAAPVARQFPRAAQVGAAVANAVLNYLFAREN